MATRRVADGPQFDHGAQYFTVRDHRFQRYVHSWVHQGIVSPWEGRLCTLANGKVHWKENTTPRFVGVPGMNAICRHLAEELQIEFNTRVRAPERREGLWTVVAEDGQQLGEFDCFITSAPAPKSAELLGAAPQLCEAAERTPMNGCWAVMLTFDESLALPFDGAFVHESPLSWIARNDTKPERHGESECWVLHASPEWTTENLEAAPDDVLPQLLGAFWQAIGKRSSPSHAASHRWRFSIPVDPLPNRSLFDPRLRIGACGDWCSGPRVEGAFLSGMAIAGRVLAQLLGVS
jgi:predicted NAD/FAD-dependent oxidoreductase